jgi:hypothetical protein
MRKSAIVAAIVIAACTDRSPVAPDSDEPSASISDAAHESGNTHFYFLPPIVPAPSPRGAFDASLSPVVEICEWTGAACVAPLVAAFTMTSGPGAATIRLAAADELYIVNWITDRFAVDPGRVYRVRVLVAGTELGYADVAVVGSAGQAKNVDTGLFIPLVDGRTLPIKFRIERGAVFVVGPAGGTVVAADGQVALEIPTGATEDLGITVTPSDPPPSTVGLLPGTVFDFGPQGTTFAEPVRLRIAYDEASLPPGISESDLTLLTEHDGRWQELPGEVVDVDANVVSAFVSGFSKKGVGGKVGSVEIDPTSATLSVCATQQFTATVRAPDGTPLTGRQVVWSSSDNAVAVVDRNGAARGAAAGTALIVAASGGEADSATMTVVATPGITSCTNIIEIDARVLSAPQFSVSGIGTFSTAVVTALTLPPGDYALDASDGRVLFSVTNTGTVDFATALDGLVSGRGTTRLTALGAAITVDLRALSAPQFSVAGVGVFPTSSPKQLRLLPNIPGQPFDAAFGAYALDAADGRTLFAVRDGGVLDYPSRLDAVQTGRGTSQLTVTGYEMTFNATELSAPQFSVAGVGVFPTSSPKQLRLLPNIPGQPFDAAFGAYALDAADGRTLFAVRDGGVLDYPSRLDPVQTGRGTGQLTVAGYAITIGARSLSAPRFQVGGVGDFPTSVTQLLRLLPNIPAAPPGSSLSAYAVGASDGRVVFSVQDGGIVNYHATLEGILLGQGTGALNLLGAPITIDATALGAEQFSIGGVGTFQTSTTQPLQLLPNIDALHAYSFASFVFNFAFVVTVAGTVDYNSLLDSQLSGRGTALLAVVPTTGGPPAYSWTSLATHTTRSLREIWGASASEVIAAADLFDVLRFDGSIWSHIVGPTVDSLSFGGLSGRTASDWYAVGSRRTDAPPACGGPAGRTTRAFVLRSGGTLDASFPFVCNSAHRGVWAGPQSIVTVGNSPFDPTADLTKQIGRVWRFQDGAWRLEFSLSPAHELSAFLHAWGSAEQDVYAVGGRNLFGSAQTPLGVIAHYDGVAWTVVADEIEQPLNAVWGTSPSNVFAVGQNGIILHFDGTAWTRQESGVTVNLNGLWGSAANNVLAVGAGGTILQYDGHTWTRLESGTTTGLTAVWMTASGDKTFVVGQGGLSLLGTVQP